MGGAALFWLGEGGRNYPPGLLMKNSALSTELSCMRLVTPGMTYNVLKHIFTRNIVSAYVGFLDFLQ